MISNEFLLNIYKFIDSELALKVILKLNLKDTKVLLLKNYSLSIFKFIADWNFLKLIKRIFKAKLFKIWLNNLNKNWNFCPKNGLRLRLELGIIKTKN